MNSLFSSVCLIMFPATTAEKDLPKQLCGKVGNHWTETSRKNISDIRYWYANNLINTNHNLLVINF